MLLTAAHDADTLRFTTAGSVDDGKSTLIGRLLYDTQSILDDQVRALEGATIRHGHVEAGEKLDLSLLTDGLMAEREQGITIDVAYRYFTSMVGTEQRRFIIADTPGHEQYTRNMVTGASTADLTIILLDVSRGLTTQSKRHALIASLLRIPQVVVAVNKMDLAGYSEDVFARIKNEFELFLGPLGFTQISFIPVSALNGDMVVNRGTSMAWYSGATLLQTLVSARIFRDSSVGFRFPVQLVSRAKFGPQNDLRGYCGRVESGSVFVSDEVMVLPSMQRATVMQIHTFDGGQEGAKHGESITLVLDRQIDISRGDMIVHPHTLPMVDAKLSANLCWLDIEPMNLSRRYWLKHTSQVTRAQVIEIGYRLDVNTMVKQTGVTTLTMNEIGQVDIKMQRPLMFDTYEDNRPTGCFVLIDDATNRTVAAGMIVNK